MRLIFVLFDEYKNFLTTKISRITVSCCVTLWMSLYYEMNLVYCEDLLGCHASDVGLEKDTRRILLGGFVPRSKSHMYC